MVKVVLRITLILSIEYFQTQDKNNYKQIMNPSL